MEHLSRTLLLVALGGGLGSIARFLVSVAFTTRTTGLFPYGTFAVNTIGSLLIGIIIGFAQRESVSSGWRVFLAVGFCGGFTTFSTFSLEVLLLLKEQHYGIACLYAAGSFLLSLGATALGLYLFRSS